MTKDVQYRKPFHPCEKPVYSPQTFLLLNPMKDDIRSKDEGFAGGECSVTTSGDGTDFYDKAAKCIAQRLIIHTFIYK